MFTALLVACAAAVALAQSASPSPARFQAGPLPALAPMAVGGGQVFLEVAISPTGQIASVTPLRTTPPFDELLEDAVSAWTFSPAQPPSPMPSTVLVAALYRPPSMNAPTLGEMPRDVSPPSPGTPFPVVTAVPAYPPNARSAGVVLVEARVDRVGAVFDATVVRSSPPFDTAALAAARQWRFRAALARGKPVSATVYIVFGFPAPVT